jgi:hypothetical protein
MVFNVTATAAGTQSELVVFERSSTVAHVCNCVSLKRGCWSLISCKAHCKGQAPNDIAYSTSQVISKLTGA